MKKILISGYYGFDNFGDDAILQIIVTEFKKHLINPRITVLSANPKKTKLLYKVDSVHRYNFKHVINKIKECDVFVSGGGSLLQDVTSTRSIFYYLSLIFLAKFFKKKTIIFAQGIGPINNIFSRIATKIVLSNADLISVRDKESQLCLKKLGIDAVLATDPVWCTEITEGNNFLHLDKINIGVQLREWKTLTDTSINIIADTLSKSFNGEKFCINLISLQDSQDFSVIQKLENILLNKNLNSEVKVYAGLSVEQGVNLIGNLDYLIAMRFHACLIGAVFDVPTLALSYDPKVTNLALESQMPLINIDYIEENQNSFSGKIEELISKNEEIRNNLKDYYQKKYQMCKDSIILLLNSIIMD